MDTWKQFLDRTIVENLLEKDFKLISALKEDSVLDVLKLLRNNKITSVPIYDNVHKKWLGLVDTFDLMTVLVFMSDMKPLADMVNRKDTDWYKFFQSEQKLIAEEKITAIANSSDRNPWCPVSRLMPLHSLMDILSSTTNLHRVPVVDDQGEVIGLVSQSKVIQFLYKNVERFPNATTAKVKNYLKPMDVFSITADKTALEAFQLMQSQKVNGLAVVDDEGKLIGSLSASDLKGSLDDNLFDDMYLPIGLYLEKGTPSFDKVQAHSPVSCKLESTVYELLHKLSSVQIHRIFVIDDENKPIGILSLCDIISMLNIDSEARAIKPLDPQPQTVSLQ
eukprot:TRINITY_DN745_c0_g1_i1.p1 TRINITY_DN745_c0_g1~~TRINITY_DN745_c0_g1_i1.p1  ORF type:complete len:335 (-),score=75.45 TRINITY_DN745_c0_g1_i1:148-1152(-)